MTARPTSSLAVIGPKLVELAPVALARGRLDVRVIGARWRAPCGSLSPGTHHLPWRGTVAVSLVGHVSEAEIAQMMKSLDYGVVMEKATDLIIGAGTYDEKEPQDEGGNSEHDQKTPVDDGVGFPTSLAVSISGDVPIVQHAEDRDEHGHVRRGHALRFCIRMGVHAGDRTQACAPRRSGRPRRRGQAQKKWIGASWRRTRMRTRAHRRRCRAHERQRRRAHISVAERTHEDNSEPAKACLRAPRCICALRPCSRT